MATALKLACSAIAVLLMAPAVFAQSMREDAGGARFDVSGYAVEGRVLLKSEDFTRVVAPFIGRQKTPVDVARARDALQQAYHDLGHCSARVTLSRPTPQDGVVAFRLIEISASDARDCLPLVVLDERKTPGPAIQTAAIGDVMAYPYVDVRDSPESPPSRSGPAFAMKIAAQLSTPSVTRAPPHLPLVQTTQSPVMLQTSMQVATVQPKDLSSPGVTAAPYVEGRGNVGLILTMDDVKPAAPVSPLIVAQAQPQPVPPVPELPVAPASTAAPSQPPHAAPEPAAEKPPVQVAQAPPVVAPAEITPAAPTAAPKFEIQRYQVDGNTLLTRQKIDQVLAPFIGKNKDFGDVQRALEALQGAYQADGYGSVEIRLPEQELERGVVRFVAVEAKIGKITVEGNEHFTSGNIRRSVPALREGATPNSRDIAQSIRLANENPAKQSTVLLKGAEQEGQIDATIRVADIPPSRYSLSFDNTGNENTGRVRMGLAYQHANLFDRDHVLTAQFLTAPANFHDVSVYGLGYRIPLYSRGDSIDFVAGYSDVDSGTVQDLFNVTGKGAVYALRYNHGLTKWGDIEHKLIYGLDYRAYQNNVKPVGGNFNLVPDITVHPFSVTYLASLKQEQRELSMFLSFVQNLPGMNDGTDDIFKQARFQVGTAGYRLFRFGGSYSRSILGDWQARIRLDAQYSEDTLVTGEQFAIGGSDNVRGFNERFTSNDKGFRTNWEIYSPDWAKQLGLSNGRLRFLTFYDTGKTYRNQSLPGEFEAASLDSWGIGIRFSHKNYFTTRLDVAHVLHDGTQGPQGPLFDGKRNIKKVHFSTAWVW